MVEAKVVTRLAVKDQLVVKIRRTIVNKVASVDLNVVVQDQKVANNKVIDHQDHKVTDHRDHKVIDHRDNKVTDHKAIDHRDHKVIDHKAIDRVAHHVHKVKTVNKVNTEPIDQTDHQEDQETLTMLVVKVNNKAKKVIMKDVLIAVVKLVHHTNVVITETDVKVKALSQDNSIVTLVRTELVLKLLTRRKVLAEATGVHQKTN